MKSSLLSKSSASRPNIGPVVVHSFKVSRHQLFFLTPKMPFYYGCDVLISYPTTSQERFLFTNISGFFYRDGRIRVGSKA